MKLNILALFIIYISGTLFIQAQENEHAVEKLKFLAYGDVEKGVKYAKENSKPTMIYFNAWDCKSCEKFAEQVLTADTLQNYLKSKYICIKANMKNGDASSFAKKFDIFQLPQIVLLSADQKVHYILEMKLNIDSTIRQAEYFIFAMAIRDQILLFQETNNFNFDKASEAIAISYAKRDFKKKPNASVDELIYSRCLNMKMFEAFAKSYRVTWEALRSKKK